MKINHDKSLLITGGGTGGHLLAGISVADAWKVRWGKDVPVLFVGAYGGIEERLIPKTGYPLKLLKLGTLNQVSLSRKFKTYYQLPLALLRSAAILLSVRPRFVLGVGGYASGPVILMARVLRILGLLKVQIGILEQNAIPGFTNRILGQFVDFVFAAFPGTESKFPKSRVILTGNPIRSSMKWMPPAARDPFTIFIFGGSQGAIGMNTLVLDALPELNKNRENLKFIHQTGAKDFDRVREAYEKWGIQARVEKYIEDMTSAYSQASLVICRTGSSTLAELSAVGRAAILIPLPTAADNHQEKNARIFADAGASCLLLQQASQGENLARLIQNLMAHPSRITEMEKRVTDFSRPHAAEDIVQGLMTI